MSCEEVGGYELVFVFSGCSGLQAWGGVVAVEDVENYCQLLKRVCRRPWHICRQMSALSQVGSRV